MQALRAELEKTELDKLRWRDLANDTKNRLKHERAGISIVVRNTSWLWGHERFASAASTSLSRGVE